MKKHFADLEAGQQFVRGGVVYQKIKPVYTNHTPSRLKANYRNVKTGNLIRCRGIAMVEVVND